MEDQEFIEWVNSDNVVEFNGIYRTQCSQYRIPMTYSELFEYFTKEYLEV